jgi:hypothetical protein
MTNLAGSSQLSDFPATEVVLGTDLIYSENATTDLEQKTTVAQLQYFVLSPISTSASPDAGTLLDSDTVPMGRSGLFQTTWAKLKAYVLAGLANGSATPAGPLTGTETVPVSRGSGLLQTTTGQLTATFTFPTNASLRAAITAGTIALPHIVKVTADETLGGITMIYLIDELGHGYYLPLTRKF